MDLNLWPKLNCPVCGDRNPEQNIGPYCCYECFVDGLPEWDRWYHFRYPEADDYGGGPERPITDELFDAFTYGAHGMSLEALRVHEGKRFLAWTKTPGAQYAWSRAMDAGSIRELGTYWDEYASSCPVPTQTCDCPSHVADGSGRCRRHRNRLVLSWLAKQPGAEI